MTRRILASAVAALVVAVVLILPALPADAHWQVRRSYCKASWPHCHVLHR